MGERKGRYLEKLRNVRKDQWFILLLAGILIIVIAIPVPADDKEKLVQKVQEENSDITQVTDLETRLERILEQMAGAGRVKVMITQVDSGEKIVEKDVPVQERNSQEEGSEGVVRTEKEVQREETTVYSKSDDTQIPYVIREIAPEIGGVLVLAQGGDDPVTEKNITDAVMALFGLEAHKIKVMKMN
ncbi:MAG: stage III sporulation protein AG [Eubacteriales bacterium]|nr:stage III sporulation protein AG [Eubacteriales bacterium]